MMKTVRFIVAVLCSIFLAAVVLSGCNKPDKLEYIEDTRGFNDYEYTKASVSAVDALGRVTEAGSERNADKDVGLFYFLWLGAHSGGDTSIYDVTEFLENAPDELWNSTSSVSPTGRYHFWGEPLYGYYHSADPWVLTRHVELFTNSGIDFLMFDTTNGPIYDNVVKALLKVLDKFQGQGFDVPKVAFLTNSGPVQTVRNIYNTFYKEDSPDRYPNLWYSPLGKPLIASDLLYFDSKNAEHGIYLDFFDARQTQWPNALYEDDEAFPWISWSYPQTNHNGVISVSVAQHTVSKMSLQDENWGRGFSQQTFLNNSDDADKGVNYQFQWDTVFNQIAKKGSASVKFAFITGWNEWIAIKFSDSLGQVYFVDAFNKEYSRDVEMMKGGYGDNFYLQTLMNNKKLRYGQKKYYKLPTKTIDYNGGDAQWSEVRSFKDFSGDALERDSRGYISSITYKDGTNRNDITDTQVTCDSTYIYVRVTTADEITQYTDGDENWMNIWFATEKDKSFNYVLNREYGKLFKVGSDGSYMYAADADIAQGGKALTVRIAKSALGMSEETVPAFRIRVSDNVDAGDRMNFYIQGDSAPIGETGYMFGTFL